MTTGSDRRGPWWYRALRQTAWAYFAAAFHPVVEGLEHVPSEGGYVVSLNHIAVYDPPLVGTIVPVQMRFMAKKELFVPVLGRILEGVGAIPIDRGAADRRAVRRCIDSLKDGYPLSVFPEGTRNVAARGQPRGGAAFLALHAGVPVLPGAILGPYRFGGRLYVRFGPPIDCAALVKGTSGHERVDRLSATIMAEIERIHADLRRDYGRAAGASGLSNIST